MLQLYHTCTYDRLPEDKHLGSKHVEDTVKIKILVQERCIWLAYILRLYHNARCKKKLVSNPS